MPNKGKDLIYEHEGGEDDAPEKTGPPSKADRYKERSDAFSVTENGMTVETGLNRERGCTDPICVLLFLAFIAAMFGVAIYGYLQGDPKRLVAPYDFTNNICGVDEPVKDYPKLYFTKLAPGWRDAMGGGSDKIMKSFLYDEAVCVKECPEEKG